MRDDIRVRAYKCRYCGKKFSLEFSNAEDYVYRIEYRCDQYLTFCSYPCLKKYKRTHTDLVKKCNVEGLPCYLCKQECLARREPFDTTRKDKYE